MTATNVGTSLGSVAPDSDSAERAVLITGGAGFVGSNLAHRLLGDGHRVMILDNLSRPGVERNLAWLRDQHDALEVIVGDVRDASVVRTAARGAGRIFHFAAQVAVTTSLDDPVTDFEVNARGTLNVLEAARTAERPPMVVLTSTNKVYGALDDLTLRREAGRYQPANPTISRWGVDEGRPLEFHTPYGCSKGAADQYVLDYAHSYGLPAVVFRMSCIYGPRQMGTEDQGWVAHFLLRALAGEPVVIYGDGRQVRDVLFIDDLVEAFLALDGNRQAVTGRAFNIGGGPGQAVSLLDVIDTIPALGLRRPDVTFEAWRTGDQRYYVSDTRAFATVTGWRQRVGVAEGMSALHRWLAAFVGGRAKTTRDHVDGLSDVVPLAGAVGGNGKTGAGQMHGQLPR